MAESKFKVTFYLKVNATDEKALRSKARDIIEIEDAGSMPLDVLVREVVVAELISELEYDAIPIIPYAPTEVIGT